MDTVSGKKVTHREWKGEWIKQIERRISAMKGEWIKQIGELVQ